jgi:hypothetical protein
MAQVARTRTTDRERPAAAGIDFYHIGGVAAWLQLIITVALIAVTFVVGGKPASAEEYFTVYGGSKLVGLLRDDIASLIVVGLYLGTVPALYLALRRVDNVVATFAALFSLIVVVLTFATHTGFSMMYLSDRYAAAATAAERAGLLAAGEAVIASDIWNSTGGYMSGILLQGAGVLFSLVMLRSGDFGKITAWAGLLANGIDLLQHVLHPFAPALSVTILYFSGPFYLLWFPLLGRDLLRLARRQKAALSRTDRAPTG